MLFGKGVARLVWAAVACAVFAGASARASSIVVDYSVSSASDPTGSFVVSGGNGTLTLADGVTQSGVVFGNLDAAPYYASDSLNYNLDRAMDVTVNGTDLFSFTQTLSGGAGYADTGSANQYRETLMYFDGGDVVYDLGSYGTLEINLQPSGGFGDGLGPDANTDIVGDVTYNALPSVPEPSALGAIGIGMFALAALGLRRHRFSARF